MSTLKDLKTFYDAQASKFHGTRKKHWPEFDYILEKLNSFESDTIKVLELGCGSGRLFGVLKENLKQKIEYVGVDLSDGLIEIARSENPDAQFYQGDMETVLEQFGQAEFDVVISIAAFQHLDNVSKRHAVLKHIYRVMNYGGSLIMTNWSFSKWFLKKFRMVVFKSFSKFLLSFGINKFNDTYIPWKDDKSGKTYMRYYHIFTLRELKGLLKLAGFVVEKIGFVYQDGKLGHDWKKSRNSFFVAKKDVI